ncbi:hypothetical protein F4779DRAFT_504900 [Xylariaceae sp. FL0662B]|nr:hypothetical protein F4779DRAFT_504900 [Xylariaceae sp. FL0662B]
MSRYASSYSDDESDLDIRVEHRHASRSPHRRPIANYVEARPSRPRGYDVGPRFEDRYLAPVGERTVMTTRRSRSRDRRASSPSAPPPVIINNRIYNNSDSESDDDDPKTSRRRAHSRTSSAYSREFEHDRYALERLHRDHEKEIESTRREYELERAQKELQEMKLVTQIEAEEKRRDRTWREERELREAKKELEEIRLAKDREEHERRIKQKLELQRLKEEEAALEEKNRRDKEAKDAIERYKKEEAERKLQEKLAAEARERDYKDAVERYRREEAERKLKQQQDAEAREREYKAKMQEHLLKSGLGEKEINAIIKGKKIEKKEEEEAVEERPRPTYTRMARKHLSIETLRVYNIDYQIDPDPDYVLIKRWVSEPEQDMLWRHTKIIREKRSSGKLLMSFEEDRHHHHHHLEPEFEWVRKKERRRSRSRSPLLMYLAGAKPA